MKTALSILALAVSPLFLAAQNMAVGFSAGPNFSYQFSEINENRENSDLKMGLEAETFLRHHFNSQVGLQTGLNFSRKGVKDQITFTDDNGNPLNDGAVSFQFDYLQVPVLLHLSVGENKRFYCNLGYAYGFLLGTATKPTILLPEGNFDITENYRRHDHSAVGALGVNVPVSKNIYFSLESRFSYGVGQINEFDFIKTKNRSASLMAGLVFDI